MAKVEVPSESNAEWEHAATELFNSYEDAMKIVRDHPSVLRLQVKLTFKLVPFYDYVPEEVLSKTISILASCLECKEEEDDPTYVALLVAAVHCLTRIARLGDGRFASKIAESGAIGFMMEIIESNDSDSFLQVLLKCLWVLVSSGDGSCRTVLAVENGVRVVTSLLRTPSASMRRYLLEILSALAMVKSSRKLIVEEGRLGYLVEAIGVGSMTSRGRACHAIGLIGASSVELRQMLAEMGAIPLLIHLFNDGDRETKVVAANALGLALTNVRYIRAAGEAGAIPLYAQLLRGGVSTETDIAVDAFCLLSIAEENAVSIVEHVVGILKDGETFAKESACHVLWDIAAYEHSVHVIQNSGAFHVMLELLRVSHSDSYSVDLEERLCSVIAKLSSYKVHRLGLIEAGAIQLLVDVLMKYCGDPFDCLCREYAAKAIKNFFEDPDCRDKAAKEIDESFLPEFEGSIRALGFDHLLDSDAYTFEVHHMSEDEDDYDDDVYDDDDDD